MAPRIRMRWGPVIAMTPAFGHVVCRLHRSHRLPEAPLLQRNCTSDPFKATQEPGSLSLLTLVGAPQSWKRPLSEQEYPFAIPPPNRGTRFGIE
eukprot:CAMPEP_0174313178 /NCGR_PEP_ID=MMETSP0810-20121108/4808_1 /TAXON_ID=73025 ORGANISM="Eutreptiella gymnastica-like, Strain CCMP1594" /NCGR_SAMPLE_ID=MMETSP0810 /ASSEMBLY_ACC=CAM_ASM_000659 /LENGTH=93 /DNA_ID=CAMNT_0015421867 /DNA_START=1 /DNA_END=279 /DNA_ORIENTATION=+